MESIVKSRKVEKKMKKLQHIVFKETGVICVMTPTKKLVISNAGLVNGLSEEIVYEHFSKYGVVENIVLLPGKSCSFISYTNLNSAVEAFNNFNGKLNIGQYNKPIYLLYTEDLPNIKSHKIWDELPPGLIVLKNFITEEEEAELLKLCEFYANLSLGHMKHRQVKHYGYEFRYDINNVDKETPLDEKIPSKFDFLWKRLQETNNVHFSPDQLTVNHYNPGQGIPHHIDTHSAFEDPIISLSLQSSVVMDFKKNEKHICVYLPRRSLTIISNESRYGWTHGITPRKFDVICSENGYTTFERGTRISFTFRKVLQRECNCSFKEKCDSYTKHIKDCKIEDQTASELELLHVHRVYDNIATHFSDTRHKPWPNVLEFVESFDAGSILIDIGCGNGKYLGQNKNIFDLGCDRSIGLIDVCKGRGFEAFIGDCLNVPLKDNTADGILSIAVIHHLANEDRRLHAIKEIIRILKLGGLALIYVWAKDQHKDRQKSSYLKQDRRNRKHKDYSEGESDKSVQEMSIFQGVPLPVHTNRTQFKHSDLLVPWKLKSEGDSKNTFLRFYHVFEATELENLCKRVDNVDVVKSYYDQGNWCVIIKKI